MCPPRGRLIRSARNPSLLPVLLLAGVAALTGCYKPAVVDGGFVCGPSALCPNGYTCFLDRCHRKNADGGISIDKPLEGPPDMATDPSHDIVSDVPEASDVCVPRVAVANCTPNNDPCDPVCQTGCCTTQKCSALNKSATPMGAADLGCVPSIPPSRGLGDRCDPTGAGTPDRFDNCAPGLVCIQGNAGTYCLKLCRDDADCGDTRCETRPIESAGPALAHVCGLAATPCDPTPAAASNSGCPAGFVCYLISSDKTKGDVTTCDISSGDLRNVSCKFSRECLPGLTCPPTGLEAGICRPVCSHTSTPPNVCPAGTVCETLGKTFDTCFM